MLLSLIQETRASTQETKTFIQETRASTQETKAFIQETRASTQETKAFIQETRSLPKSPDAAIRNLETQLGQLAHERAERPTRTFGANSENNLREECKAVMTQAQKNTQEAGTMIEDDGTEDKKEEETKEEEKLEEEEKVVSPPNTKSQKARKAKNEESPVLPQDLLYPKVSTKKNKEHCFMRFLEIFKGLEITMPFGEALQQMPLYSKFMKDIITKKEKYIDSENIVVGGNCSAIIQRKLPKKFKDLGSVTIPCSIGKEVVDKALIDLGASINLMLLSMCR
ncbi:uncharacterized protein [Glycine max]|uniref:uncharacterized protein n=1 Tax=Glycine max TaxID=3847 RepID=UPI0003DE752C|nr:uncharacterized protein LOC102659720 [Glycine max]|eukprot:XP_006603212.1 uncharacterized protein LOC102659720 [Glycine max]